MFIMIKLYSRYYSLVLFKHFYLFILCFFFFFFFQAEDGIRDIGVTGVQTCALPICARNQRPLPHPAPCPGAGPHLTHGHLMIEVEIVGVRIELPSNQPLVLLREMHGERHVPIWIGTPEASAIALAQQGVVPPRPMTHDLLVDVVESLGHSVVSVNIVRSEEHTSELQSRQYLVCR